MISFIDEIPVSLRLIFGFGLVFLVAAAYVSILPPHRKGWLTGKRYRMPPGPDGHPVTGSLPSWLRARKGGATFGWLLKQAQQGEMTTLSMGSRTWVLLNTSRAAKEIISKRAALTHERPYFPVAGGLVSRNKRYFLTPTAEWKEGRQLIHNLLAGPGARDHGRIAEEASLGLLRAYLDDPRAWYKYHYRYNVAIMHKVVTGAPLAGKPARALDDLQRVTSTFLTSISASPVDFFPRLARLVPPALQPWRSRWAAVGEFHRQVFRRWWAELKTAAAAEEEKEESFVRRVRASYRRPTPAAGTPEKQVKFDEVQDEHAMYLVLFVMSAGADNPRMALNAWVMACVAHPDKMRRAREELDRLCGVVDTISSSSSSRSNSGSPSELRLPALADLPRLPYVCAVIKEVLRWRPTVPLMPPRVLVRDLAWEGYLFPAGTEFLVNSVAACASGYDRPDEFRPERWLSGGGAESSDKSSEPASGAVFTGENDGAGIEQDLWEYAFSGGRRMCAGYRLAQRGLFVAVARLLYCFDFAVAGGGLVDDKKLNAFEPGEPFPVRVTVRSAAHERLIREQAGQAPNW